MIEYIKEYGITNKDYEYIIGNVEQDILDLMVTTENNVREILNYYNTIGLTESIALIIINRPDLIIIDLETLEGLVAKIDKKTFVNLVKNAIDDLIILGI